MVFFESKEIKDFRKKHFDDMTAANSLISNLRFSQGTVQGYDEFMMNLEHILEFRRLMLIFFVYPIYRKFYNPNFRKGSRRRR